MVITSTADSAFTKVFLDIVGQLPKDCIDFVYVLNLQCLLTKFTEAYPLRTKNSVSVARTLLDNSILRLGIPREIATDRVTEFYKVQSQL